jgi:DNA replication and repair protein RecF
MVSELRLHNFRCFELLMLKIPERGALFVGDNAEGKTSVLEAVCMLVRLQSPRVKRPKPMIRAGQTGFGVAGTCWEIERQVKYGRGGLSMRVEDKEELRQSDYFHDGGLIVWMGNDDLDLVRGTSEKRRKYLDFLGCQLDLHYRTALVRYRRALKLRNVLLKNQTVRESEISAYDTVLIQEGDYLSETRQRLLQQLEPWVGKAQLALGGGKETVQLEYKTGREEGMAQALQKSFERDRQLRQTMLGPHRDDIKLTLNGFGAEDYASEGQQRTLALALKLAQGDLLKRATPRMPIFLLDDIFGELDPKRRNAVIDYLPKDAQILITTTNLSWLDDKWQSWKRFHVTNGKVF